MTAPTTKQELLEVTRSSRAALDAEITQLTDAQMLERGVTGDWSVKDSLAHISAWERMFIGWIDALMRGQRPNRPEIIGEAWTDSTNARLYDETRDKSLADVRAESQASYEAMLALIERLSEDELFDPQHFPWARGREIAPWVRGNADEHYDEHREMIARWRVSKGQ